MARQASRTEIETELLLLLVLLLVLLVLLLYYHNDHCQVNKTEVEAELLREDTRITGQVQAEYANEIDLLTEMARIQGYTMCGCDTAYIDFNIGQVELLAELARIRGCMVCL